MVAKTIGTDRLGLRSSAGVLAVGFSRRGLGLRGLNATLYLRANMNMATITP